MTELANTSAGNIGTLVIIRHGESEFNAQNRFAGWVETPLTEKGIQQAKNAGKLLRSANFSPDIVYSSTLERAIDTGKNILAVLGIPNKQIVQSPELLERHYGGLTGMNKAEAKAQFGDEMFLKYRRSYDEPPPPMNPSHNLHPDSTSEEPKVIGMPPNGKGTESLEDVVKRVKPFWEEVLLPQLQQGKKIMISAHGNSLRALTMLVNNMTPEQITKYEIENAVPIMMKIQSSPGSTKWEVVHNEIVTGQASQLG